MGKSSRRYTARLEVRITPADRDWLLATAAQSGTRPGPWARQLLRAMLAGEAVPAIGAGEVVLRLDLEPADRTALHRQAQDLGVSAADLVRACLWRAQHTGAAAPLAEPPGTVSASPPASPLGDKVQVAPGLFYAAALYGLGRLLSAEGRQEDAQAAWQESRRWFAALGHRTGEQLVAALLAADEPAAVV